MKLFLDTAHLDDIRAWAYMIDGVTTNPSHLAKENNDPKKQVLEICSVMHNKDVSVEITYTEPTAVYQQALALSKLAPNIVVKVPCHHDYYPVIAQLVRDGVKINVTLVFTLVQSLFMCKLGVTYISPFIGRWDDIDIDGTNLLFEIRSMIDQYDYNTQILAASIRHIRHLHETILAGADVATIPASVLEKSSNHILTKEGMEQFNADWNKLGHPSFP